ncbi:outer membrane beta-barrel protein [Thalassotalea ponticola]|uniref:outer membrane beta-barrel protein n=1 Tax=Thalassotalea ponticola TaxID=1523392 RepID=UPI0025B331F0|nr:outer membrane beta-barrel protein [Thalassotalea ponticola]MDN3651285.1 outer membrane beta-barrel protein [Thalassotalea ponticola]
MKGKIKILAALCLSTSSVAHAESVDADNTMYVGGFIGQATYDLASNDFGVDSFDDSDTSFKLIGGYQINAYISIEGGYTNLGELTFSLSESVGLEVIGGGTFDTLIDGSVEVDGLIINVVGSYPVAEQVSIYAKVGMFSWDSQLESYMEFNSSDPQIPSESFSVSESEDGSDVFYGLGLTYHWNDISFRAEYELFESDSDQIDVFSIGAVYNF